MASITNFGLDPLPLPKGTLYHIRPSDQIVYRSLKTQNVRLPYDVLYPPVTQAPYYGVPHSATASPPYYPSYYQAPLESYYAPPAVPSIFGPVQYPSAFDSQPPALPNSMGQFRYY